MMKGRTPMEMETLRAAMRRCYEESDPEAFRVLWDVVSSAASPLVAEMKVAPEDVADKLKDLLTDWVTKRPHRGPFLDKFSSVGHFKAYVKKTVHNNLVDDIRGNRGRRQQWPTDPARLTRMADSRNDGDTDSEWVDMSGPYWEKLEQILPLLNQQELFILRCLLKGMTHRETAKQAYTMFGVSWSVGNARVRWKRLKDKIRLHAEKLDISEDTGND